ncbi:MAG: DNA mismatch repair endonuclease MutL [Oscillospiraceae bacterium]|nr:DNA mismatch repair endonuclease MutL [Oscillospiraceae bacterium]
MNRIHLLDKSIYDLIAAGEVVDKPASVVKELVENSVDSGADNIVVEIKNGGKTYIRVTDNGCGIAAEDVPLAFVSHATSKIATKEDLDSIMTLGFRGEALASICTVSKVQLMTKRQGDELGFRYEIEGGVETSSESTGCPDGTTIIVRDLFYSTPARQKFLKKDTPEGNSIANIVQKIALSHPEISIKFIRDNKVEFVTSGDGKLLSAIYTILGKEFYEGCIPVDYKYMYVTVKGYVTKPLASRSTRAYQNYFVNSRYIKCPTLITALEEAYKDKVMVGKHPGCVLNISMPADYVDVNAHPTKMEVRFQDNNTMYSAIYYAVKDALLKYDSPEEINADHSRVSANSSVTHRQLYSGLVAPQENSEQLSFGSTSDSTPAGYHKTTVLRSDFVKTFMKDYIAPYKTKEPEDKTPELIDNSIDDDSLNQEKPKESYTYINEQSLSRPIPDEPVSSEPDSKSTPLEIRVIGEAFKTYVVAQCGEDILLVDKHAAHERLIYEGLKRNVTELDSQMLLNPVKVALTYDQYEALNENQDVCQRIGIGIQFSNAPEVVITGSPMIAQDMDPIDVAIQVADSIVDGKKNKGTDIFDDLYHTFACKAAIKANSDTNIVELEKLMELITEEDIRYCPHGRPILVKLSKREIEKMFRRIV